MEDARQRLQAMHLESQQKVHDALVKRGVAAEVADACSRLFGTEAEVGATARRSPAAARARLRDWVLRWAR